MGDGIWGQSARNLGAKRLVSHRLQPFLCLKVHLAPHAHIFYGYYEAIRDRA